MLFLLPHLVAPNPPAILRAVLVSDTIIVTWTQPALGGPVDLYLITYEATIGGPDTGNLPADGSATEFRITGRSSAEYSVTIMSLSAHIPSIAAETTTVTGGEFNILVQARSHQFRSGPVD